MSLFFLVNLKGTSRRMGYPDVDEVIGGPWQTLIIAKLI